MRAVSAPAPTLSLILPAWNEAAVIRRSIDETCAALSATGQTFELLVVAGGDDGTAQRARDAARLHAAVRVLDERGREGKGRAVRRAVQASRGNLVGFADADGKVPPTEVAVVLEAFAAGADVVIGSRAVHGARIERRARPHRRLGSVLFTLLRRIIVGLPAIRDTQCGFKFFTRSAALALFAQQQVEGYMFDVELLARAEQLGLCIREVPVRWLDDADSRFNPLTGTARNVRDLLRIRRALRAPAPRPSR